MPKAAYCSECAGYVWLGKDGGCANGHARSCLRELYDAQPNLETGKPLPQFSYPPSPESPTMREAGAILGTGAVSLAAAAGRRMQEAAARLTQAGPAQLPGEPVGPPRDTASLTVPTSDAGDAEPQSETHGGYRPLQPLAHVVDVLLKITIGVTALAVVVGITLLALQVAVPRAGIAPGLAGISGIIGYLQSGLWLVVAVLFLMWVYRLSANLRTFSGHVMEHTPGWAVGWFFVPIAFLFKPYQVMKEAWQVSHGRETTRPTLVGWWWFLYLASNLIGRVAATVVTSPSGTGISAATLTLAFIVSDLFTLAMYVAFLLLVARVSAAYSRNICEAGVQKKRLSLSELRVGMARVNRRQVLTTAGVLVLAALLFPPWIAYRAPTPGYARSGFGTVKYVASDPGYSVPVGWHFIFVGPTLKQSSYAIDWSQLTVEFLLIVVAAGLAIYTLPNTRRRSAPAANTDPAL